MRTFAWIVLAALAVYATACLGLFLAQRSLIYFPVPRHFGAHASVMKVQVEGAQLEVSTRPLAGAQAAVLYFGGNAEDVSGSLAAVAQAFPQHAVYMLHYRGYGGSSGKPSEQALFADSLALFDQLLRQHPNITLIGRSLGSGVAVHLASVRPVERLVLVTPYDSIAGLAAQQFPMFPVAYLITDKFESWRYAPLIKVPTTIVAAENDQLIPAASSRLLQTRFKPGVVRYVEIPDTGHNTISDSPIYAGALHAMPESRP